MLKELLKFWKGESILNKMLEEFAKMIDDAHWMFQVATEVAMQQQDVHEIQDSFYSRDKQINSAQRLIRRQIVEHLTCNPGLDIPYCLVLMSIVKDAERIGDYCKNVFDVGRLFARNFDHGRYATPLLGIRSALDASFDSVKKAFAREDEVLARDVVRKNKLVAKKCELLITQLIKDELPTDRAVAYTLISRHFKRIALHLSNIATSVVVPVHELDYADEAINPKREGAGGTKQT